MNLVYKKLWSVLLGQWIVAHERSRSQGGRRHSAQVGLTAAVLALALSAQVAAAPPADNQLPTGGQVVGGNVSIAQNGARMDLTQTGKRAVVNWNTFDVGAQAQVNFAQPGRDSVILNRVLDSNPSRILGKITANGQVFLTNPNGVYFSPGASVDVGGLVATTHAIDDDAFMAGSAAFERAGATGSVINEGNLKAALGGYIALLAPEVRNAGVIIAQAGTVAMAAGERITLNFEGGSTLAGIQVTPSQIRALVENRQAVLAPGGLIVLSAHAAETLQGGVVNNSGRIEANGLAMRGGKIVLEASDRIENSGSIRADAAGVDRKPDGTLLPGGPAGSIMLNAPVIVNSGALSAAATAAASGNGGQVTLQGGEILQQAGARIDVSAYAPAIPSPSSPAAPAESEVTEPAADLPPPAPNVATAGEVTLQAGKTLLLQGEIFARGEEAGAPAASAPSLGGTILIEAAGAIRMQGAVLDASGAGGGGRIHVEGGKSLPQTPESGDNNVVLLGGATQLRVSSRRGSGGSATVTGREVSLQDETRIDASGANGGGLIQVGGSWQGQDPGIAQASSTRMARGVMLDASATEVGNGGSIAVWSDIRDPASVTRVYGTLLARGGAEGGDGGRIETSGHWLDVAGISVSAAAPVGVAGLWLLDPYNVIIAGAGASGTPYANVFVPGADSTILASDIDSALQGGNNVTITTGISGGSVGDITVSSAITKASGDSDVTLTLQAANSIVLDQAISNSGGAGKLNVIFDADNDNGVRDGAGIILLNNSISTGGGNLRFGTGATITINGVTTPVGGDVYVGGGSAVSLTTGGGDVTVQGEMIIANSGGLTISTANGNLTFGGQLNSGNGYQLISASMQWNTAYAAAKSGTGALVGDTYLATITSRLENAVAARAGSYADSWLGGHRGTSDGTTASYDQFWRWVSGPEGLANSGTGTVFYTQTGNAAGTVVNGLYGVWSPGEPNNCNATVCGVTNYTVSDGESAIMFSGTRGLWNDKPDGIGRAAGDSFFSYTKETNLAASPLTVNAGAGTVTFSGAVGSSKSLASLNVTAGTIALNGGAISTEGAQTYSGNLSLGAAATTLKQTAANSDFILGSNIQKTTAGTASLILQATRDIVMNDGVSISSSGGALNVVLNSNSDGTGGGAVLLHNTTTISTSGGNIAIGGGTAGDASGEATGADTVNQYTGEETGVRLGWAASTGTDMNVTLDSAGGNISIRGRGSASTVTSNLQNGIFVGAGTTIDSGSGTISLTGYGTGAGAGTGHGIDLAFPDASNGIVIRSANTGSNAVTLYGDATGSTKADRAGIQVYFGSALTQIAATGAGGSVTLTGRNTGASYGLSMNQIAVLSASGSVTLDGGSAGIQSKNGGAANGPVRLGASSTPGSLVTNSSANVTLTADRLDFGGGGVQLNSGGTLVVQPYGNSFSGPLTLQPSGLTLTGISGLTLGKSTNTADIVLNSAISVAGPINIQGGNLTLNANLAATASGAAITLAGTGNIVSSGQTLQTSGGDIILNSDADGDSVGGISLYNTSILSAGGNILLGGGSARNGTGYSGGLSSVSSYNTGGLPAGNIGIAIGKSTLQAGGGNITLRGKGIDGDGTDRAKGIELVGSSTGSTLISTTGSGSISLDGQGGNEAGGINYGVNFNNANPANSGAINISTEAGNISITGVGGSAGSTNHGVQIEGSSGSTLISSGSGNINITGIAGAGTSNGISLGSVNTLGGAGTSGDITLTADTLELAAGSVIRSSGALIIRPLTLSTTIGLGGGSGTLNLTSTELATFNDGFSAITIGRNDATGKITAGTFSASDHLTLTNASGGIEVSGAINVGGNRVTLSGDGTLSDTGAGGITAGSLLLLGGNATLDGSAHHVGMLAASGVGSITFVNAEALTIGTVGATQGIAASGAISIATASGDLNVAQDITTSDGGVSAVVLNAGRAAAAGTGSGGNLLLSGNPAINTGAGGRATLYSGMVSAGAGLQALAGSGSGRFRYNSDETTVSYSTALGSGIHVIFREQVNLSVTANDDSTYPQGQPYSGGNGVVYSGFVNGDDAASLSGSLTYSGTSQGAQAPGAYEIIPGGLASGYGYSLVYVSGTLTLLEPAGLLPPPLLPPPAPQPPLASMAEPVIETPADDFAAESGDPGTAPEAAQEVVAEADPSAETSTETSPGIAAETVLPEAEPAALAETAMAEPSAQTTAAEAPSASPEAASTASMDAPPPAETPRSLAAADAPAAPATAGPATSASVSASTALAGADGAGNAVDGLAAARVEQTIAGGMDPAIAQQGGQSFTETLVNLLSQGMEMGAALARAGQAFDTQTAAPRESVIQNLTAGGDNAAAQLNALSGATSAEGHAAFDRALAANLARGVPMTQALQAARAAVVQAEALARADASPQAMLANGSLASRLQNASAAYQQALGALLAKGVNLQEAMRRADALALEQSAAAAADARNPATALSTGHAAALPARSPAFDSSLQTALARGASLNEALQHAQQADGEARLAAEVDARSPGAALSGGQAASITGSATFDRALSSGLAKGLTPAAALARARQAESVAAPPETAAGVLAGGKGVDSLLPGGASQAYRTALNNALARGIPPERAMALAKQAEQSAQAGKDKPTRVMLRNGTQRIAIEIPDAAPR